MSVEPPPPSVPAARPVLLFDAECGLCQRIVRHLLRRDREGKLAFAALQGPSAQAFLRSHGLPVENFDTLTLVPDWNRRERRHFLLRTAGVIAALRVVGRGPERAMARVLSWIPAAFRDAGYRAVARWRYRMFGPWRARPWDQPGWAERFLE